ncbi:MAG: RNA-binding S4 domain-containing protein [Erysipelothrix sp.]|nr:RNA-binding S4 domain-containing protein [Erysipelothrix sp.]
MRIDKFLKVARVLKRRTVAKELADHQRIVINGKTAKPSTEIKENDIVEVIFGHRKLTIKIMAVIEHPSKKDAGMLYEVLDESFINLSTE